MTKISVPSRGQPIDVTYLHQLATAINEVSNEVSPSINNNTTVYTQEGIQHVVQTRNAKIIAGYKNILNATNVTQGEVKTDSFSFPSNFLYTPVGVITVVNNKGNDIGDDVTVTIRSITTSNITFALKFNKAGSATVSVNILLIGIAS